MALRLLGKDIDQWEEMPWWWQQVYMEGFDWELAADEDSDPDGLMEGDELQAAASFGVRVQNVG